MKYLHKMEFCLWLLICNNFNIHIVTCTVYGLSIYNSLQLTDGLVKCTFIFISDFRSCMRNLRNLVLT